MANIFDGFLKQLGTGDTVKDFKHASRLIVTDNYRLSPKYTWLYHVYFDFASTAQYARTKQLESGMLVKSVSLPKYSIDNRALNSYNRKEIVQTKLRYPSIDIDFHDDSADVVRHLWFDYLTHSYRDTDLGYASSSGSESGQINPTYYRNSKYRPRNEGGEGFVTGLSEGSTGGLNNFGYTPRTTNTFDTPQYLNAIRVYSLHQKRFSEYTLINPIITGFDHGTHDSSSSTTMTHRMTVDFTSVLYATGDVNPSTVLGFGDLHYDKSPSTLTPQGGGVESILGPGGFVNAIDTILSESGIGGGRGPSAAGVGSALFTTFRAFQNAKTNNTDFKGLAETELTQAVTDILRGQDPRNTIFVPDNSGPEFTSASLDKATAQSESAPDALTKITDAVSNGTVLSSVFGGAGGAFQSLTSRISGIPGVGDAFSGAGTLFSELGAIAGSGYNQLIDLTKNAGGSTVDATGQSTTPVNSGYFGGIANMSKDLYSRNQALVSQAERAATGTTKISPALRQNLAFTTGTNTIASGFNVLSNIPGGNSIGNNSAQDIAAMVTLAGEQGQKYINNGNIQELVDNIRRGRDTNPESTA